MHGMPCGSVARTALYSSSQTSPTYEDTRSPCQSWSWCTLPKTPYRYHAVRSAVERRLLRTENRPLSSALACRGQAMRHAPSHHYAVYVLTTMQRHACGALPSDYTAALCGRREGAGDDGLIGISAMRQQPNATSIPSLTLCVPACPRASPYMFIPHPARASRSCFIELGD